MDEKNNSANWLKEDLTKEEAQSLLKNPEKPLYSFLVTSSNILPWLTLLIKLEDSIKQFKIYKDSDDFYYFFETKKFDDLEDLIKNYSENNWNELINQIKKTENEKRTSQSERISTKTESFYSVNKNVVNKPPIPERLNITELQSVLSEKLFESQENNIESKQQNDNDPVIAVYCTTDLSENIKKMSRIDAEKYLSNKDIYSYLIRTSNQTGSKCLSIKTEKDVQHFVIYSQQEQFYIRYGETFPSLNTLIETYSENNWNALLSVQSNCDTYYIQPNNVYDCADHYQTLEDCHQNCMKTFTREEAENYLSKLSVFSYIVRPSRNGDLSLSVKLNTRIYHYLIHSNNSFFYIYDWALFPTISALVKTYAQNDFEDLLDAKAKRRITNDLHVAKTCKETTKKELMTKPYYSYVIRDSSNFSGCKCLTIKFPEGIFHFIIFSSEKGFYIYKPDFFASIESLMENYSRNQWKKLLETNRSHKRGSIEKFAIATRSKIKSGTDFVINKMFTKM